MSDFATEYTRVQTNISDAYDSISLKGGTLPVNQNSNNLASSINSIPIGFNKTINVGENAVDYNSFNVENIEGFPYGFSLNNEGYYESQNKGIKQSTAFCKLNFTTLKDNAIFYLECIADVNYSGEEGKRAVPQFHISTIDAEIPEDPSTYYNPYTAGYYSNPKCSIDFDYVQMAEPQLVPIIVPKKGNHYLVFTYTRGWGSEDGSEGCHNDSFQFKIYTEDKTKIPTFKKNTNNYHWGQVYIDGDNYKLGTNSLYIPIDISHSANAQGKLVSRYADANQPVCLYRGWEYTTNQSSSIYVEYTGEMSEVTFLTDDIFTYIISGFYINDGTEKINSTYMIVAKVNSDNTVTELSRTALTNVPNRGGYYIKLKKLSDSSVALFFGGETSSDPTSNGDYPFLKIITINTSTGSITQGNTTNISTTDIMDDGADITVLSSTAVFICGAKYETFYGIVCTISGTSITKGSLKTLSNSLNYRSTTFSAFTIDSTHAFICFCNTEAYYGIIASISTRTITWGTTLALTSESLGAFGGVYFESNTKGYLIGNKFIYNFSISGTSLSTGNLLSITGESGITITNLNFAKTAPLLNFIKTSEGIVKIGDSTNIIYSFLDNEILVRYVQNTAYEELNDSAGVDYGTYSNINSQGQLVIVSGGQNRKYKSSITGHIPIMYYITKPYTKINPKLILRVEYDIGKRIDKRIMLPIIGYTAPFSDTIRTGGMVPYIFDSYNYYTPYYDKL